MTASKTPCVEFKSVSKVYPATKALDDVSFAIPAGCIHAILGEAGSGKSTLIRILAGLSQATEGHVAVAGRPVRFWGPSDAIRAGLAVIHQESHVFPAMTVAENLFLCREPGSSWIVNHKRDEDRAKTFLGRVGIDVSPAMSADRLTLGQQKMLQICKALIQDAPILAFDEPTHSLSAGEAERLFDVIADLKQEGRTIILVTRRIEEVFRICDSVTVLRDGEHIETLNTLEGATSEDLLSRMLGRDIAQMYKSRLQRIMRGVIHNVGNSATVSNLAQQQTHERLEQECLPLMDFVKEELMPSLKDAATNAGGEVLERTEALEKVLQHLETGLREAVSSMHTVDDRLKHIGSIVEIQQNYVDELGTEDVTPLKRIVDEATAIASSDRLVIHWAAQRTASVLVDRSMLAQLIASFIAELLRVTVTELELTITDEANKLILQLQSAEPVALDNSTDLASIVSDAKLFFERYNGCIEAQYTPHAMLRAELPRA